MLQGVCQCMILLECYRASVSDSTHSTVYSSVSVPDYMLQGAFQCLMTFVLQGVHV